MRKRRSYLADIYVTAFLILMYLPIAVVVVYSFNDTKLFHWEGFTLDWYVQLFGDRTIQRALWNSLVLAALSTLTAVVIGTLGAQEDYGKTLRNGSHAPHLRVAGGRWSPPRRNITV